MELKDKTNNDYLVASIYDSHYERVTARVRADINYENLSRVDTIDSKNYYKISTGEKYKFADKSGFILDKEFSLYSWVEKIDGKLVIVEKDLQTKIYDLDGNVLISSDSGLLNWSSLDSGYLLFQNDETKKFTLRTLGKILFEKELSNNVLKENYIQDSYGNFWFTMDSGKTYDTEENQNLLLSKLASLKLMTDTVIDKTNDVTITMSEFITKNYEIKTKILSKEKTAFSEEFIKNIKLSSDKEKVIDIYNFDIEMTDGTDLPNAKYVVRIPIPKNIDKYNPVRMVALDKDSKILEKEIELTKDKDYYTFEIGVADLNTTSFALVGDEIAQVSTGIIFSGQIILLAGMCIYLIIKTKKKEKVYSI